MNNSPVPAKVGFAAVAALLAGISLTSCTAKEPAATPSTDGQKTGAAQITVNASDTVCELSGTEGITGPSTFVITNNGTRTVTNNTASVSGTGGIFDGGHFNGNTTPPTAPSLAASV